MASGEEGLREVIGRIREIERDQGQAVTDKQEEAERLDAAKAYFGENEQHFVDYAHDCIKTSVGAMQKIRKAQKECWAVFNEEDPPTFARKQPWQSKVTIPKPNRSVQFAMATVKKAFSTDFLSIKNEANQESAVLWEKALKKQLDENHANFAAKFSDASGMAFAVGQSMEIIPIWRPDSGLELVLVEPWKIHRDPDAIARDPWSGMYWIHQEWVDWWKLVEGETNGQFFDVKRVQPETGETSNQNPDISRQNVLQRKDMYWERSKYRKYVLVSEFWGTVLSPRGEMILPNATYTIAGNHVIKKPDKSPYPGLRWPGVSFSPLPNFLRFDGRGLLHGVRSLWYFMCSLMCLHNDYLNWLVNPMREVILGSLVDQDDLEIYPAKTWLTRETVNGQQAVRNIEQRSNTNEIMAWLNFADQYFGSGTMVTDAVSGLPGWRQEVAAKEKAQDLDQSMSVFSLMAGNLENGALQTVNAIAKTIRGFMGPKELDELLGEGGSERYRQAESPTGLSLPELTGQFHVSGMQAIVKDFETMKAIRELIMPLAETGSIFLPYLRPYYILKSIEKRANLEDEKILVDEAQAMQIDAAQQQSQEGAINQEEELAQQEAAVKAQNMEAQNAALNAQAANQMAQAKNAGNPAGGK